MPTATPDTITVSGVGTVDAVPNEAQMSFGAETRKPTAQAAVAANADAMRKIINALRQAGGRELATQWVSVYPYTDDTGNVTGYSASNSVSRGERRRRRSGTDRRRRGGRREPDQRAGAQLVATPRLSTDRRSQRRSTRRGSMPRRSRRHAGRSLGSITAIVEGGRDIPEPMYRTAAQADSSTPIVPGEQETTATVSVTFSLR